VDAHECQQNAVRALIDYPATFKQAVTKAHIRPMINTTGMYEKVEDWPALLNARGRLHVNTREAVAECEHALFANANTVACKSCTGQAECKGCAACGLIQLHRNYKGENTTEVVVKAKVKIPGTVQGAAADLWKFNPIVKQKECLTFMRDHILKTPATAGAAGPYGSKCHESCREKFIIKENFAKADKALPNFCRMPDETCKAKIKATMESNAKALAYVCFAVEFLLLFILFFSQKAIKMWAKLDLMHLVDDDGKADEVSMDSEF